MTETSDKISVSCPACQKLYRVPAASAGKRATCKCGQQFTIEAGEIEVVSDGDYAVAEAVSPVKTATPACKNHPNVPATAACSQCRSFICSTCDYPQNDGSHLCLECAGVPRIVTSDQNPYLATVVPQAAWAVDAPCRNHPESMAIARCQRCKTPVCDTCDFVFPGGIHICPACATDTSVRMSPSRKQMIGWSLAMAGITSVLMVLLMSGVLAEFVMTRAGDIVITTAMKIVGMIGLGLAFGSLDSRAGNPAIVWVTIVWNCLVFGAFLLLVVVGVMTTLGG